MIPQLLHIICTDDEPDILEIARLSLEMVGGFQVTACSSGMQAIAAAEQQKPDLAILDVMMPEMDGLTTLARLRALPGFESLPIILMTAKVQPEEVVQYLTQGATAVIPKPFDPMNLANQVNKIWATHWEAQHVG